MSIKFSQFADYDPTTGEPGDMTGVGLQGGQNVKWPAWYFQSSEEITTGASPVNINPEVFLHKITSGGTGGREIVNIPNPPDDTSKGKPHLIYWDTRTNINDLIQVKADDDIYIPPFSNGVQFQWSRFRVDESMTILSPGSSVGLEWAGGNLGWVTRVIGDIGDVQVIYSLISAYDWGPPDQACPATLYQDVDGTYNAAMDPTNPQFQLTVTASANISAPTNVPGGVRSVWVNSAGNGGPSYIQLEGPAVNPPWIGATGIQHVVMLNNLANPSDTVFIAPSQLNTSVRNADGTFFTSVKLDGMLCMHWDNVWITDEPTNCTTVPPVKVPLLGDRTGYAEARSSGTVNVTNNQNYTNFSNAGTVTYNLPPANQSGNVYTFTSASSNLLDTITVVVPPSTTCYISGRTYTSPTFSTSQRGATISFRDIASPEYIVEKITGAWNMP